MALVYLEGWLKGRRELGLFRRDIQIDPHRTWSDGFSQLRTCLSMPTSPSLSAASGGQQQVVDADAVVLLPGAT